MHPLKTSENRKVTICVPLDETHLDVLRLFEPKDIFYANTKGLIQSGRM